MVIDKTASCELSKVWTALNPNGDDKADVKELKAMFKKMRLLHQNETEVVEKFIKMNSEDGNFTEQDMIRFLSGEPPKRGQDPQPPKSKPADKPDMGDVEVEARQWQRAAAKGR